MQSYHETSVIDQPIGREWIGQSEETPLDVLRPTIDECEAWVSDDDGHPVEALPRYEARLAGNPADPKGGYHVWDRVHDHPVGWFRWLTDALALAEDLVNEDHPDCGDWWATLPTDPDLDQHRYELATAGSFPSASDAWIAEGRARLAATGSTRGDLTGRDGPRDE